MINEKKRIIPAQLKKHASENSVRAPQKKQAPPTNLRRKVKPALHFEKPRKKKEGGHGKGTEANAVKITRIDRGVTRSSAVYRPGVCILENQKRRLGKNGRTKREET